MIMVSRPKVHCIVACMTANLTTVAINLDLVATPEFGPDWLPMVAMYKVISTFKAMSACL